MSATTAAAVKGIEVDLRGIHEQDRRRNGHIEEILREQARQRSYCEQVQGQKVAADLVVTTRAAVAAEQASARRKRFGAVVAFASHDLTKIAVGLLAGGGLLELWQRLPWS